MATVTIEDDWRPTAANINALPLPLRDYIHKLESHMDPAYTHQQVAALQQQVAELSAALAVRKAFKG